MSTFWDFTVDGASVLKTLRDSDPPREQSFDALSLRLVDKLIYLYEAGVYASAIAFEQMGTIDGDTATDLQDAYDKIEVIIPSGGSVTPSSLISSDANNGLVLGGDNKLFISNSLAPYIIITDLNGDIFTDKNSFLTWMDIYGNSSTFTNVIVNNGRAQFTCPVSSAFNKADGFLSHGNAEGELRVEDKWGLISEFATDSFRGNIMDNEFSTYANLSGITNFIDNAFRDSTGNNILNGIYTFIDASFLGASPSFKNSINNLNQIGSDFANSYKGRFDIIKFTALVPSSDLFTTANLCWIRTPYSNKFNDIGDTPDGNILNAIANMSDINSNVFYD